MPDAAVPDLQCRMSQEPWSAPFRLVPAQPSFPQLAMIVIRRPVYAKRTEDGCLIGSMGVNVLGMQGWGHRGRSRLPITVEAMRVGIDGMAFAVPERFLAMDDLAASRGADPAKYHIGLGQDEMAVAAPNEDLITFGVRACEQILTDADRKDIDLVLVGTESAVDESKAAAIVMHRLLGIQPFARCADITEACYGATAALHAAVDHVRAHPDRAALVIASDIAKYGLETAGEPTQGAGAIAMVIRADPRVLAIEDDAVAYTNDVYDFWRPFGELVPRVNGPLSKTSYVEAFTAVWQEHERRTGLTLNDYGALCFHLPYTKMGWKALRTVLKDSSSAALAAQSERLTARFHESIALSRRIGNLYTGSLYLGLISLLLKDSLREGDRIGLFSYGSGSVGELFSGTLANGYRERVHATNDAAVLDARQRLSFVQYEKLMRAQTGTSWPSTQYNSPSTSFTFTIGENDIRAYGN